MNSFIRSPLTQKDKDKKMKDFLTLMDCEKKSSKKKLLKILYLRVPVSYWKDIQEIMSLTGLSMNAVCLELLRPSIKKKIREIKNDLF